MNTELLFQNDTFLYATLVKITNIGQDEFGTYFLTDRTIFYPQGGGQPNDFGWIESQSNETKIVRAKYNSEGQVKHYFDSQLANSLIGKEVAMHISQRSRKLHSAYHTAGHWLSQIVNENLELPLFPVKGHHFPGEAYVAFEGSLDCVNEDTINQIQLAMRIDLQTNPKIVSEVVSIDSPKLNDALLPQNFRPMSNRPMRLVTIEGYKAVPCGGTHYDKLRNIKSVVPTEIYKKGNHIRLKYECSIWDGISC